MSNNDDYIKRKLQYAWDRDKLGCLKNQIDNEKKQARFRFFNSAFTQYGKGLYILLRQMRRVKWCFHFTRNNPNHTKRFYFRLKEIVGLDKWHLVCPEVRQAWEDASNRFDMQYGLVRAWTMTPWVLEPMDKTEVAVSKPAWMEELERKIECHNETVSKLVKILNDSPQNLTDKLNAMDTAVKDAKKAAEEVLKTLTVYNDLANHPTEEETKS